MITAKYFDVHDKDVTPAIYTLLFSGVVAEIKGNDLVYDISYWVEPDFREEIDEQTEDDYWVQDWEKRIGRGSSNCYHDKEAMVKFIANPCSVLEAVEEFLQWLKEKGVEEDETLLVKIWW